MPLLAEIMGRYLYAEDIKRLAWEHDLPSSRTKDELINELLSSGELEPEEVVAFVKVDDLREICQELGIPSGAARDVLAERVVEAIEAETRPKPSRTPRKQNTQLKPGPALVPPPIAAERPARVETDVRPASSLIPPPLVQHYSPPINLRVTLPPVNPPAVHVYVPEVSGAGWAFASIILAVAIAGTAPVAFYALGLVDGAGVVIAVGAAAALILLATSRRWEPWVSCFASRGR
jgi:hypothetical protein